MIINKKVKKYKKINLIKIIFPIFLTIFLILAISNNIKNTEKKKQIETIKKYDSIDDFTTLEEVAIYFDCKYVKHESSKTEGYTVDVYMKIKNKPFSNNVSNKSYYESLFVYCAKVVNYENFIIIDKSNELVIALSCDKENKNIKSFSINGDINYFQTQESIIAKNQYIEIQEINYLVNSNELQQLINKNWIVEDSLFGTKDSIYRNYNIFFDEGISVRKINGKIFNIVFNSNYKNEVVNGLKTTSSKKEIIDKLGNPQFEQNEIIGYKTENTYIFFNNNEISVYKSDNKFETIEFSDLVSNYIQDKDLVKFTSNLKNIWSDYDLYEYNSNYLILQYSLKGIQICLNYKGNSGINVYTNFKGNIVPNLEIENTLNNENQLPKEVYFKNENLVFLAEKQRIVNQKEIKYDLGNVIKNSSNDFIIDIKELENSVYAISFVSSNLNKPNRELKEYINYGIWKDDENFIYSVKQKGIYNYNVKNNLYSTLITGKQEFNIKKITDNTLEFDNTKIEI
ncbi:MAG TPA: hypothetical protein PK993_03790 [Clostridia bacterium]|nr:hypothetical protein [Clostridia bacterium]